MDGVLRLGFHRDPTGYRLHTPRKHYDGWNAAIVLPRPMGGWAQFRFSANPGALHGTVTDAGDPVVGAPVFIEPMDVEPARRLTDAYVTITDVRGRYHFGGLAPGHYRVLSSFSEYQIARILPRSW